MKKEKGITLISLVVMIICIVILSGISLNIVFSENSVLGKAKRLKILNKYSEYKESVGKILKSSNIYISGELLSNYISDIDEKDIEKFVIVGGELFYIGDSDEEKEIAKSLEIDYLDKDELNEKAIKKIIIPYIQSLNENEDLLQGGLIKLYDNNENSEKCHLAIDYDEQGNETGRYGDGYYLIKSGKNNIDGEEFILTNNYVLTSDENIINLSSRYEELSV